MESLKPHAARIAFALGAAVWLFSPLLTGRREAWDAPRYYFFTLVLAGLIPGLLGAPFRKAWLLVIFGEFAAILLKILVLEPWRLKRPPEPGLFVPLGVIALVLWSFPTALGAWLGARLAERWRRKKPAVLEP